MLYLIAASRAGTLASGDPVVPAAAVAPLREAATILDAAGRLHAEVESDCAASVAAASATGFAAGHAAGLQAASAEAAKSLFDLNLRAADERRTMRAEISGLALGVVRRIAGNLGDEALVAALAERAAQDLAPDVVAAVRVAPAAVGATVERLRGYPGLTVVGDATLAATDCVIETPLGASHAGLDVQLAAVERAWDARDEH